MSDEKERAQYYQAHKDDEDEWGEPERPPPAAPKRRLASMISVRFSPDEADIVRRAAEDADESLSHFVRKATLQRCLRHYYGSSISFTGAWQEVFRSRYIQSQLSSLTTVTDGGPEAGQGSRWTPNQVLVSSTTS
jgi:hypothetical protein